MTEQGDRYDSTRQAWENIWDRASVETELQTMDYPRARRTLQAYLPYLPQDEVILEAGSGLGAALIVLRRMGYPIVGMDYALNALRATQAYHPTIPLVGGDVHDLPFADNSLGAYLSFGVLEHFEHGMQPALHEAYRVLKPDGILVLTIPYPNVVQRLVRWRRQRAGASVLNDDSFYESTYTRREMIENAHRAGFEVLRVLPTSHSFTLWGLGGPFRAPGYYRTSRLAEGLAAALRLLLPWPFNFETLLIGRKDELKARRS